jgi:hypothetical protein
MDKKLATKSGIWRTDDNDMEGVKKMEPSPYIEFTILTFSLPEQTL